MLKKITLILALTSTLSYADYHYASHTGSSTYPYTSWETAADSIQVAMNAASPYDTIYIGSGTFVESIFAGREDSCLTFIGAGIDSTILTENTTPNMWLAANNTTVRDMCFELATNRTSFGGWIGCDIFAYHCRTIGGGGMFPSSRNAAFEDCEFIDCSCAIDAAVSGWLIFRNNYIRTNVGEAIMDLSVANADIENNICEITGHNRFCFFSQTSSSTDSMIFRNNYIDNLLFGPYIPNPLRADISNNTIRRVLQYRPSHQESAFSVLIQRNSVSAHFDNNAVTESGYGFWIASSIPAYDISIAFSGFWSNIDGNYYISACTTCVDTIGNIEAYPMYANPDSYDVHLQAYSPFIDAGDPLIYDLDGTRSDIGVFGGPEGSSYNYQDLAPRKPDSLSCTIRGDSLIVSWRYNYESDFWRYIVNRDTIADFIPWAGNIFAEPDTNLFVDLNWDRFHNYYYKIAAYDNQGNLSPYSDELAVIFVGIDDNSGVELPDIAAIESNYPNPFNSSTTIIYTVANLGPIPAQINIDIYDIGGRKVRSLLDSREEVGRHQSIWDGKDDYNRDLASGIYFAKITQWQVEYLSSSQKLLLVR
jgi:hypothetical protein